MNGKIAESGTEFGIKEDFMKLLVLLIMLSSTSLLKAEHSNQYILFSKYSDYEIVKNSYVEHKQNIDIIVPATLSIVFEIIEVIQGDERFSEKSLSFLIKANSVEQLKSSDGIVLVVKRKSDLTYELLDWDIAGRVFCISDELVLEQNRDVYFKSPFKWEKRKSCRFF